MPNYPLPATATNGEVADAINDLNSRLVPVEEDDAKAHGFIQWCYDKRAYLIPIGTALFAVLSAWVAARNNSLPGVQSEPTPVVKPAESKTASTDKLEEIRKSLKEQSK